MALAGDQGKRGEVRSVFPKRTPDQPSRRLNSEDPHGRPARAVGVRATASWQTSSMYQGPNAATSLLSLAGEASSCSRCRLSARRTNVVFGTGNPNAQLMFVGEGPGEQEDLQGLPFVGRSGQLLDRLMLEEIGITREDCYIGNVVLCRPPGNRDPLPDEIEACHPYLEAKLDLIQPKVVVTLGNFATRALLGTTEGISRLRGHVYPYRSGYLVPTFHPSAALRGGSTVVAQMRADLVRAKEVLQTAPAAGGDA